MDITFCSDKVTELAKAMISVQQSITPALRDGVNNFTQSSYATLESVMEVCRKELLSHGIWMTQYPVSVEAGYMGLVTKIVHAATGQWQASLIEMPLLKNDPQGYGSAITYARRYGLSALIGITTEDDDGESAIQRNEIAPVNRSVPRETSYEQRNLNDSASKEGRKPPKLDGVTYRSMRGQDGKERLLAVGNTHAKKEFLKSSGFKWDGRDKVWWRYAYAA